MKGVNKFYKDVLLSLKTMVADDGYIYVGTEEDKHMILVNGKPMVIPLQDHINSMVETDDEGKCNTTKVLYNVLNESVIKGNGDALNKTKNLAERRIGHSIASAGELLLEVAANTELQKKTNLEINKFLSQLSKAKNIGVKDIVDETTIKNWVDIYKETITPNKSMVTLYLNKIGKVDGTKYNRSTVLSSMVYEELLKADKNTPVMGHKLRNKDIIVFRSIFEYLLEGIDDNTNHTVAVGSNDTECPAFISLMKLYYKVISKTNEVADSLKFVSEESYDECKVDLMFKEEDLDNLSIYKSEVLTIPDEIDVHRGNTGTSIPKINPDVYNTNVAKPVQAQPVAQLQNCQPTQQFQPSYQPIQQGLPNNTPMQLNVSKEVETTNKVKQYLASKGLGGGYGVNTGNPYIGLQTQQNPYRGINVAQPMPMMHSQVYTPMNMMPAPVQIQTPYTGPMVQTPFQQQGMVSTTNVYQNPAAPMPFYTR